MLHLYAFTCQLLSLLYGVCLSYAVDVFSCCIRATAVVFGYTEYIVKKAF